MPITITTLNNEAAVAKTFDEIAKDRTTSQFINSTDSTSGTKIMLEIRQRTLGVAPNGSPIRQGTVVVTHSVPVTVVAANGNSQTKLETYKVSASIVGPENASTLTATHRKDLVAFLRNFLTAANVDKLAQGQV